MEALILDIQAEANSLREKLNDLRSLIEEKDPEEDHEGLQEIASRLSNVEVEVEYLADELDTPEGC